MLCIRAFERDELNIDHIAHHDVSPDEVEEALAGRPYVRRGRRGRYYGYGCAASGRYLFAVFVWRPSGVVRVITAREMTEPERKIYRRKVMQ